MTTAPLGHFNRGNARKRPFRSIKHSVIRSGKYLKFLLDWTKSPVRARFVASNGVECRMRTIALAVFAVLLAIPPASTQAGPDPKGSPTRVGKPIRTAAIHPRLEPANQASDAIGRPLARGPITRLTPTRSAISKLQLSPRGQLTLQGYGRPGTRLVLTLNRVRLASITVNTNSQWRVAPQMRLLPGNYRFSLERLENGLLGSSITDEIRLSVPASREAPINVQFKQDEALQRQAEKIGEEASKVFDRFFSEKNNPGKRVAQANQDKSTEAVQSDQPILDATFGWLGAANDAYQRQIVPRLQIGGALSLPNNVTQRVQGRHVEISTWSLPTIGTITNDLQEWFGRSADNYDDQIIPRLSGARERRIVIQRPIETEVVKAPDPVDEGRVTRQASDERREAELRRQRNNENEQLRIARAEQARLAAERERLAAERQRAQERERRLAAQRTEQARLDDERRRTEQELAKAEASRLRAAAERKKAEDAQRVAELSLQQKIEDERQRVNNEILERKRQRDRAIAEARLERERAKKLLTDARRAREASRQRELARIRQERQQRQVEEQQQQTRLSDLWLKAKRAARDAMARVRAEQDPANRLTERQSGRDREIKIARRNVRSEPPELPTQNRYRTARPTPRSTTTTVAATPPPLPDRIRNRIQRPDRTRTAVRLPVAKNSGSRVEEREQPSKQRITRVNQRPARATKIAKPSTSANKRRKQIRVASTNKKRRKKRVLSYRKRSHPCRNRSARRVRLPGKYVVRKGDSLWRISRRHYRRGHRYWRIYRANLGKIRNPDLIYPCQRFYIPKRKSQRK